MYSITLIKLCMGLIFSYNTEPWCYSTTEKLLRAVEVGNNDSIYGLINRILALSFPIEYYYIYPYVNEDKIDLMVTYKDRGILIVKINAEEEDVCNTLNALAPTNNIAVYHLINVKGTVCDSYILDKARYDIYLNNHHDLTCIEGRQSLRALFTQIRKLCDTGLR